MRITLVLCLFAFAGCDRRQEPDATVAPVVFDFAIYYAPAPASDPETTLQHLIAEEFPQLAQVMTVQHRWERLLSYPPPTADALRYSAHGVTPEQRAAIQQSTRVFILSFTAQTPRLLVANRLANDIVARLAKATSGFPWDEECRLLYTAEAWREKRVDSWQEDLPDVRGHVNLHAYRNPELVRIITLGMRKFGLPDLVVTEIPSSSTRAAGHLVNALAQFQVEGAHPGSDRVRLRFAELRHAAMRASALENPLEGAMGEVRLRLRKVAREDGDPSNTLLSLEFPDFPGTTPTEKALAALASAFGANDKIVRSPSGDVAMRAASERARTVFFARVPEFRRGLAPNEQLLVKTGFEVPGGTEYMWVEVTAWQKDAIAGVLVNDSHYDRSLREGLRVTVALKDVYDFIHRKADGTLEGNETGRILQERNP